MKDRVCLRRCRLAWSARERLGLIGPPELATQVRHAAGFLDALEAGCGRRVSAEELIVDLGSGGGLPGMVCAARRLSGPFVLIEGSVRRAKLLAELVGRCGWEERVTVLGERAEAVGHDRRWRGVGAAVFARGFGGPAETAECASALLEPGGVLIVSEPPGADGSRWDSEGLARLGMEPVRVVEVGGFGYAVIRQVERCPEEFPRRVGVPRKRPLFRG